MKLYDIMVIGATNLIGRKLLNVLDERKFPTGRVKLFADDLTVGHEITFKNESIKVQQINENAFNEKNIELAFFLAGSEVSEKYIPFALKNKITVIDDSSFYRLQKNIPLVVPELNAKLLTHHQGIISNPNCTAIFLSMILRDLHVYYQIKRVVVTTIQTVTGAGVLGLEQLTRENLKEEVLHPAFKYKISGNIIPAIGSGNSDGFTSEEMSLSQETNKILNDETIHISATCLRGPIIGGQNLSINFECAKEITVGDVKHHLGKMPGIVIKDDLQNDNYPMPLTSQNKDEIFVGRIRKDPTAKNSISLFAVSDNLRKGTATNLVQIAEELLKLKN